MGDLPTHDPDCLFCKIARHELPAQIVLETDEMLAFLDLYPVNPGHLLLVPKEHHSDLSELSDELSAKAGALLPKLCRAVKKATGVDAFNVVVNNGRAAGQTVSHGHWHIIPRYPGDAVRWPWPHCDYPHDELGQMRFQIERELNPNLVED